jgi:hypothetical protein
MESLWKFNENYKKFSGIILILNYFVKIDENKIILKILKNCFYWLKKKFLEIFKENLKIHLLLEN